MPLFKRKPPAAPLIPVDALKSGEEVERSVRATLLQGRAAIKGSLYMSNHRLLFHADKGEARWLVVPYDEIKSVGLYPAPRVSMGAPGSRGQCLFVETEKGEQVWWDFGDEEERAWLPLVQEHVNSAAASVSADSD